MSNVANSKKRNLIYQLISKLENSSYKENGRRELTEHLRVTLKFITPESDKVLKRISSAGRILSFSSSGLENIRNQINAFDDFKNAAISNLNGLLTEIELSEQFEEPTIQNQETLARFNEKVFIVHGHDDALKDKVARFIENLNLKAIILHEQSDRGQTIISKFEANSDVGFAIVLYTPCDVGRPTTLNDQGKQYPERNRARQNVIFEHGFFAAKLGLENVVALKKGDVEIPNDLSGVIYKEYDEAGSWKYQIAKELDESGYEINYKLIK